MGFRPRCGVYLHFGMEGQPELMHLLQLAQLGHPPSIYL